MNISRETWDQMESDSDKLNLLFDLTLDTNREVKKLKKRRQFDTTISAGGGFIGGLSAMVGRWIFFK